MTVEEIRSEFPELSCKVYGKPLVYLDNAATSQRPFAVIRKWDEMSGSLNANLHRAVHCIAGLATDEYESTRQAVARFIGAESPNEIVFTSGATASINLVAFSFGEAFVHDGDNVVVTIADHHSNIVPWQMMCCRKGAQLRFVDVDDNGELDLESLERQIDGRTKIVAVPHISNVLGIVNPVRKIAEICHEKGIPLLVDGAQGIVHEEVDVQEIGCDFYAFSGHKMYAAPGTGVLYGRKKWLDAMPPYMGGGEMIATVKMSGSTYAQAPHKFEAGTQNIAGTPTLKPAIDMVKLLKHNDLTNICNYICKAFDERGIRIYGTPKDRSLKAPVFSFTVPGVHHEDLALILDKMGIAVRSGQMCAEPLMDRFSVTGMVRASFAPYNTMQEAEYFVASLDRAIKMLK